MNRLAAFVLVGRNGAAAPFGAPAFGALVLATGVILASSSCTLLLPTDQLVVPCQSQADCDDKAGEGFVCEDNACLPEDDGSASG
jgi:hypothetical protein